MLGLDLKTLAKLETFLERNADALERLANVAEAVAIEFGWMEEVEDEQES